MYVKYIYCPYHPAIILLVIPFYTLCLQQSVEDS